MIEPGNDVARTAIDDAIREAVKDAVKEDMDDSMDEVSRPFIYAPCSAVSTRLERYLAKNTREMLAIPQASEFFNGYTEYRYWIATPEGRLHMQLMAKYVLSASNIDAKSANVTQRKLQSQGKSSDLGVESKISDKARLRKFRIYLLDMLVAKALGVDQSLIKMPYDVKSAVRSEPVDRYDSLARFEEWTKIALPRQAWLYYSLDERLSYAKDHAELSTEPDGGISFSLYKKLRSLQVRKS